jgi:hypothetical protein
LLAETYNDDEEDNMKHTTSDLNGFEQLAAKDVALLNVSATGMVSISQSTYQYRKS